MTRFSNRVRQAAGWVWRRASAGVALALIVMAFVIGSRTGGGHADGPAGAADAAGHRHGAAPESAETPWYTCSMHPSVRLKDPDAKCPICFMDLIPVSSSTGGGAGADRVSLSADARERSRIETTPVRRYFPEALVRLYGKVTLDQTTVARLTAYVPGRLDRLFVNYTGVPVSAGDHIAEIYSPELIAAFEELRQAGRAQREQTSASELIRQATLDTLVAAREKLHLYGLKDAQIAAVEEGRFTGDRLEIYAPFGGVVTHLSAREGDYLNTGDPVATVADLSRLWVEMEAYESQLPLLRWGQRVTFTVEARPGEVFEGRVSFIEPFVDETTRTAAVRVSVDNTDRRLVPGAFASAVVHARVSADGVVPSDELAGRWVGPMHPDVIHDAPGVCEICGMGLVTAESLGVVGDASTVEAPLVIPRSAVLYTGTRSVVYVEVPDAEEPTYEGREVLLGPRAGEAYTVRAGLSEGELVVTHGAFRIDSAMQILAKPSMMAPEGGASGGHHHGGHAIPAPVSGPAAAAELPEAFVGSLGEVFQAYSEARAALASDDFEKYAEAAGRLIVAVDGVDTTGLAPGARADWEAQRAVFKPDSPASEIAGARQGFEAVSAAIIALGDRFGSPGSDEWNVAFCPMAFGGRGAEWMQKGTEISNPYFGSAMLRCGEIRRPIPSSGEPKPGRHTR